MTWVYIELIFGAIDGASVQACENRKEDIPTKEMIKDLE